MHMMTNIESATDFYPFTASCLPMDRSCHILDLGCGTGLELEAYLRCNPNAKITGIDLSQGMLDALREKLGDFDISLICGSYFDVPFGEECFDAAVSVESLHHFTQEAKIPLYTKLCNALMPGGYFILTDYFALTDGEEQAFFTEQAQLKAAQGITDDTFYHFDTPLTICHEIEALRKSGFSSVEVLNNWGATCCLKANR